jgi:hypothetical protein
MVGLIILIALLNIGLGFLLALHLGYGPPDWREKLENWIAVYLPWIHRGAAPDAPAISDLPQQPDGSPGAVEKADEA